ncbi:PIN domain-containing protein [Massilia norwichensis]|uniref:PIN domain-containing protein n=1 Tax=Massilia norwichensis TaxID=1442366 RepID=A0ABT2AEF1_9BURK|nr:PIN domain-containing protein [Massilia norwichensis]MCS0592598.1 PIN domain-containing protein [Massilia norwichensis]
MTLLTTFKLGVPVLRHRIRVLYATPRTPTPFEAAVLDIVHRFGTDPTYRDWALETVFEELLCVPDPRPLLSATLLELKALGIISATQPFDDSDGLAIGALALTERGKKMAMEKKLLGRQQEQIEEFAYDPLASVRCDERRWAKLSLEAPLLAIPAGDFASAWPEQAFDAHLDRHRPDWYRVDTKIEDRRPDGPAQAAWELVTVEAYIDNGALTWRCERSDVMRHLAQLAPHSTLRSAIIKAIFGVTNTLAEAWPVLDLAPDAVVLPLSRATTLLGQQPRLLVSQHGAFAMSAGPNLTAPGTVRLRHGADLSDLPRARWHINWNASHDGCIVKLAPDVYMGDADIASDTESWRLCRANLMVNGAPAQVALALRMAGTGEAVFDSVATRLLASLDHQETAAGLLLTPYTRAVPALVDALRTRGVGLSLLEAAISWGATLRRLKDKDLPGWNKGMVALFEAALGSCSEDIALEAVPAWCEKLKALALADPKPLVGELLRRVAPLSTAACLAPLLGQARAIAPGFSLPWLPNLYSAPVVKEILDLDSETALAKVLGTANGNSFDNALRELWRHGGQFAKRIGKSFPLAAPVPDTVRKLATGRELPSFRSAVQEWNRQFDEFVQAHGLHEAVQCTRLAAARQVGLDWLAAVDRYIEASGANFEHVFVVDTNALIDCPELPRLLRPTQLLVLPATVIDELDKKKTDPALRERCATAVRHLLAVPPAQKRLETADMSLLPDDFRKSADNRILAVAAKYAGTNTHLVTGDQNLCLKAQVMNISAFGVERFINRPVQRKPAASNAAPRPTHANQKKRTGT